MSTTPAEYAHYHGLQLRKRIALVALSHGEEVSAASDALENYIADLMQERDELRATVEALEWEVSRQ